MICVWAIYIPYRKEISQLILRALRMLWIFGDLAVTSLSCIVAWNRSSVSVQIFCTSIFILKILIITVLHTRVVSISLIGFGVKIWALMLANVINIITIARTPIRITCTVTRSWINLASILVGVVHHIWLVLYTYLVIHKIDHAIFIKFGGRWMISRGRRILCSTVHCHGFNCAVIQ